MNVQRTQVSWTCQYCEVTVASPMPLAFVPTGITEDFQPPQRLTVVPGGIHEGLSRVHNHVSVLFLRPQ